MEMSPHILACGCAPQCVRISFLSSNFYARMCSAKPLVLMVRAGLRAIKHNKPFGTCLILLLLHELQCFHIPADARP